MVARRPSTFARSIPASFGKARAYQYRATGLEVCPSKRVFLLLGQLVPAVSDCGLLFWFLRGGKVGFGSGFQHCIANPCQVG